MSEFPQSWKKSSLLGCTAALALTAGTFGNIVVAFADDEPLDTIVLTGTRFSTDRGPGNAGNMGPNTYGGTVKLFSQTLGPDPQVNVSGSYGSFSTQLAVLNGQSGDLDLFGTTTRVLVNVQGLESNGALSLQDVR